MPRHKVSLVIQHPLDIQRTDIEIEVREDEELLGKVRISRGTIDWVPKGRRPYYLSWRQFQEVMEQPENRRRPHTGVGAPRR